MLRNWVTQFGYDAGSRAGDEQIPELDRAKFIDQIGTYLGWNPPPGLNWIVEVTKDDAGEYVFAFYRYATVTEASRMLGTGYENVRVHTRGCPCGAQHEERSAAAEALDPSVSVDGEATVCATTAEATTCGVPTPESSTTE